MTVRSSNSTGPGRAGCVPTAMTTFAAVTRCSAPVSQSQGEGVRVDEAGRPGEQLDVVSLQLVADDVDLAGDDACSSARRGPPIVMSS